LVENLIQVDQVMKEHQVYDATKLARISPQALGRLLGVDAVVYGEVTHYEAYYLALVSAYQVGVSIRMVSTRDGRELFSAEGSRYDVDVAPAFDPIDIAINSAFTLLQLRDIVLARAEDESAREIMLRIPRSQRLQDELIEEATEAPSQAEQEDVATLLRDSGPQPRSNLERVSAIHPTD
jgi:curli biogenesis system outer membrane secretion channel CsgG